MSDWRVGEVALVTYDNASIARVLRGETDIRTEVALSDGNGGWSLPEILAGIQGDSVREVRPLVVIDPEDREAVERLRDLFDVEVIRQNSDPDPRDVTPGARGNALQAALREFAAPKPARPDEPQGLGAVVEDEYGRTHVRVSQHLSNPWLSSDGGQRHWDAVKAVRVLSEGVVAP